MNFICRRFGTLCSIFLGRVKEMTYEDGTDRLFRNVGIQNLAASESPKITALRSLPFSQQHATYYYLTPNEASPLPFIIHFNIIPPSGTRSSK